MFDQEHNGLPCIWGTIIRQGPTTKDEIIHGSPAGGRGAERVNQGVIFMTAMMARSPDFKI